MSDEQLMKLVSAVAEAAAADHPEFRTGGKEACEAEMMAWSRVQYIAKSQYKALQTLADSFPKEQ